MHSLIPIGRYRHYKGNDYEVVGTARHSETGEDLVLYYPLYDDDEKKRSYWVRPLTMFMESVVVESKTLPRFEFQESQIS
ncbi:MAG: DUF1653 domain-containing protein [Gammaproteobacteria bacterium]|nr:DUF1653 domain-containing protein [Gammaproteobacteria bacterium]